jgi:hypothetical protein
MRQHIVSLAFVGIAVCARTVHSSANGTQGAIQYVKALSISSICNRLPHVHRAELFSYETDSQTGEWEVIECGKQTVPDCLHI